jgi:Rrf2 family nitric oxide-sensitive transcriptional repressor
VQALAGAGYVRTQRGAGGGFRLARPAASITLGQVVRDLEQDQPTVECFRADGGGCVLTPRCRLRKHLAGAREAFLATLDATSLADCAWPPPSRPRKT